MQTFPPLMSYNYSWLKPLNILGKLTGIVYYWCPVFRRLTLFGCSSRFDSESFIWILCVSQLHLIGRLAGVGGLMHFIQIRSSGRPRCLMVLIYGKDKPAELHRDHIKYLDYLFDTNSRLEQEDG